MNRQEMINDMALYLEKVNQKSNTNIDLPLVIEDSDLWLNNSDNNGEDFYMYAIGYDNDTFGVFVGEDDFWGFDELSDEEIEMAYETLESKY